MQNISWCLNIFIMKTFLPMFNPYIHFFYKKTLQVLYLKMNAKIQKICIKFSNILMAFN